MCTVVYTFIALSTRPSKRLSAVYGDLKGRRFTAVNFDAPIAEGRYQQGTPQDINDRNFVPKGDLTR
jgi:hypothetical protein